MFFTVCSIALGYGIAIFILLDEIETIGEQHAKLAFVNERLHIQPNKEYSRKSRPVTGSLCNKLVDLRMIIKTQTLPILKKKIFQIL